MTYLLSDLLWLLLFPLGLLLPFVSVFLLLLVYTRVTHKKITLPQKLFTSLVSYLPLAGIWLFLFSLSFYDPTSASRTPVLLKTITNIYGVYAMVLTLKLSDFLEVFNVELIFNSFIGTTIYMAIWAFFLTAPLSLPLLAVLLTVTKKKKPQLLLPNTFAINFMLFLALFFLVFIIGAAVFLGYISTFSL